MKTFLSIVLPTLLGTIVFSSFCAAQVYVLEELSMQNATGINDSDVVCGLSWYGGDLYGAQLWDNGAGSGLPPPVTGASVYALGLNNVGQTVGSFYMPGQVDHRHAVLWDHAVVADLGTLGGQYVDAAGVNDSGEIVGTVFDSTGNSPFFWKDSVTTLLPNLGQKASGAAAINNLHQVVGTSRLDDTIAHAFLWENGSMSDLGTLGGYNSDARAINGKGQVAGFSGLSGPNGAEATLWSGGGITGLGYLPMIDSLSVYAYSVALGINDTGEVVGESTWGNNPLGSNHHAFIWQNGTMKDLNDITALYPGTELISGQGINNRGNIICLAASGGFVRSVLLRRKDLYITYPAGFESFAAGERETIRWKSGIGPGQTVDLDYSANDGITWKTIAAGVPADSEKYVWRVPDTLSDYARIRISASSDPFKFDISRLFYLHPYMITKSDGMGGWIPYDINTDRWGFGNTPEDVWYPTWYNRFDYTGTDPRTGRNYLYGAPITSYFFARANPSDFPDWPAFVDAFREDKCYWSTTFSGYSPTAVIRWASLKNTWGGSCFGFAISNAWCYRRKPDFRGVYPGFPDYATPIGVVSDSTTIPVINSVFCHQFGAQHLEYRRTVGLHKTPSQTLEDLRQMLGDYNNPIRTLSIMNNGPKGGGHAILAYKVIRDSLHSNIFHVYVYDNSYPATTDAEITIDTAVYGGNGSWEAPLWPGWGGPLHIYLRDPAEEYAGAPNLGMDDQGSSISPFTVPNGEMDIHINVAADVVIGDSLGNVTGYADSALTDSIPNSTPLFVDDATAGPPYGYAMDFQPASVTLSHFGGNGSRAYFFVGNSSFGVERSDADSTQTDRLFFDGGTSVFNPDTASKSFSLLNVVNERVQGREKAYLIRSVVLNGGDSVRIENVNTDGLKIASSGPSPKTYDLEIEYDTPSGSKAFTHDSVLLPANASHLVQPDWNALAPGAELKILIDYGRDGTIDDSVTLSNQLTGVEGRPAGQVPAEFALHQNYPNPFNPRTTIEYELPRGEMVTLKVYDVFGREVATLVDGRQEAGIHAAEWDAGAFASGVYYYRMQAGDFSATEKMVLLR